MWHVNSSCRCRQISDEDPVLRPLEGFLDLYGYTHGFWNLCPGCNAALLRGSAPKFSAMNKINVTLCQNYPEALTDLTLTEKYLIAKSHPVGVVLKLRPGGRSSPANYRALRGHFICCLLSLPLFSLLCLFSDMLSNRPCYECGRQVRLSTTIEPPRYKKVKIFIIALLRPICTISILSLSLVVLILFIGSLLFNYNVGAPFVKPIHDSSLRMRIFFY
jgi:hypothetical protein